MTVESSQVFLWGRMAPLPLSSFAWEGECRFPRGPSCVLRHPLHAFEVRPPIGPPSRCGSRYPAISDGGVLAEMEEARVGRFALRGEEVRCTRRRAALQRGG